MSVEQRMAEYVKRVSEKVSDGVSEKVSENQRKMLGIIKRNKFITVMQLKDMLQISEKSVNSNLKKMKEKGLVKRIGPAKGGYWETME
jgi:ATP-dependent DNA helicase RecG